VYARVQTGLQRPARSRIFVETVDFAAAVFEDHEVRPTPAGASAVAADTGSPRLRLDRRRYQT